MHNRPDNARHWGTTPNRAPAGSEVRLALLFGAVSLVVATIAMRVVWLQSAGRDRFTSLWDQTTERLEAIPARDGRILTADGQILAYDEPRYAVAVHYRWLESPPDRAWLTSQAHARLNPQERRDPEQVEVAREAVLQQRAAMHAQLATLLGLSPHDLQARFTPIQTRVERIVEAVEARRARALQDVVPSTGDTEPAQEKAIESPSGWREIWQEIRQELTSPPVRPQRDPLIVAEELQYHEVVESASAKVIGQIESYPSRFPGVDIHLTTRRVYPQGALAAHLVGVRAALRPEELVEREKRFPDGDPLAYRAGEAIGRAGIELAQDATLHGVWGVRRVATNRQGEIVGQEVVRPPVHGRDVVLSIDAQLQGAAEKLLDAAIDRGEFPLPLFGDSTPESQSTLPPAPIGGCLVALDVRTGEVLAAASAPRYDAGLLVSASQEEWNAIAADPRRPFFPRVTQGTLPPGSVFKLLTAVAGLEAGVIDPDEPFDCQGYLQQPDRDRCAIFRHFGVGHGRVTLDRALAESCNVYFYQVAQQLGPDPLVTWGQRFGFGLPSGCDLPGERGGNLPSPRERQPAGDRWYPGTTRQLAIGQASLTVTPLQVARMVAAIANDGWLVPPHFVRRVQELSEEATSATSPIQLVSFSAAEPSTDLRPLRVPGLTSGTLPLVRRGMEQAVEHPRGTGREAAVRGVRIAGKTGTAEIGGGRPDHAWFAGYAPAESPRIAFVVVLEQGGSGGQAAAPIAREFVRVWIDRYLGTTPPNAASNAASHTMQ